MPGRSTPEKDASQAAVRSALMNFMSWNFRKSIRLPLGMRVNLSKSGIGTSWGIRGFRVGKTAKGQHYRNISHPWHWHLQPFLRAGNASWGDPLGAVAHRNFSSVLLH